MSLRTELFDRWKFKNKATTKKEGQSYINVTKKKLKKKEKRNRDEEGKKGSWPALGVQESSEMATEMSGIY